MSRVEKKQPQYGSDVVVDLMKAFDIEYAAFNPGATFRGIHDSIVNYGGNYKPEVIFCHHEEISVAVAHGYAKAKNKPMIAIVHNMNDTSSPSSRSLIISSKVSRQSFLRAKLSSVKK